MIEKMEATKIDMNFSVPENTGTFIMVEHIVPAGERNDGVDEDAIVSEMARRSRVYSAEDIAQALVRSVERTVAVITKKEPT